MTTIEKSIDVHVPVRTAYNQWTQFESFPEFMEGVERVIQVDDTLTRWETKIGGVFREFDAQIVAQHPDELVAWNTVGGPPHGGVVTFQAIDQATTRVALAMQYEPDTLAEKAGTALGIVDNRISGDLKRFKEFIEKRGHETGGWRGEVSMEPQTHATQEPLPNQPPETDPVLGDMPGVAPEDYRGPA
ncbi:SRPBCC family protein [Kutzneria chonburiensis]|uniref:SRPBCC family protein n=1 Tax=Kutzneria chonburiensis TaxID=1483604 RepID=A0ABV6N7N9_9PSEU